MRKRDELSDPTSCMSKAHPDEWTFVLLGRDVAATWMVWAWIILRILFRKNRWRDPKLVEARRWIAAVEQERKGGGS